MATAIVETKNKARPQQKGTNVGNQAMTDQDVSVTQELCMVTQPSHDPFLRQIAMLFCDMALPLFVSFPYYAVVKTWFVSHRRGWSYTHQ
jgi:hypothetical protein